MSILVLIAKSSKDHLFQIFIGELEVKVDMPHQRGDQMLTTRLEGEAHLPQILVIKPSPPHCVNFPPTFIGDCSEERLAFINSATINCMVRIPFYYLPLKCVIYYKCYKLLKCFYYELKNILKSVELD